MSIEISNKTILVLFFTLLLKQGAMSQESLKPLLIDYLIKVGDLDTTNDKQKYFNSIYIVELIKNDNVKNTMFEIYKFGAHADHVKTYILLKNNKDSQILSLQRIDEDLLIELTFLKQNGCASDIILHYLEETIKVYQKNLKAIPWTE